MEEKEYSVVKVTFKNIFRLNEIRKILYLCGKYMVKKYGLYHWNSSYIKSWIIIMISILKNDIYSVQNGKETIATFQLKKIKEGLCFQKLAIKPEYMRKGIGNFSLRKIEKIANNCNCEYVMCEVYDKSKHAIEFYKSNGYTIYGNKATLKYNELKMRKKV